MHHSPESKAFDCKFSFWLFLACLTEILAVIFLPGCATDDPERMRVQAEGTKASHDAAHCRSAILGRAQPASASVPC